MKKQCVLLHRQTFLKGYGHEAQSVDRKTADVAHQQSDGAALVVRFEDSPLYQRINLQIFTDIYKQRLFTSNAYLQATLSDYAGTRALPFAGRGCHGRK